jgi:hypothetical protein
MKSVGLESSKIIHSICNQAVEKIKRATLDNATL